MHACMYDDGAIDASAINQITNHDSTSSECCIEGWSISWLLSVDSGSYIREHCYPHADIARGNARDGT